MEGTEDAAEAAAMANAARAGGTSRLTYSDVGDTSRCTQDCSGHDAGWNWAEDNDITDPDDCGGNSWSFEDGCRAYAEGRMEEAEIERGY